eukprot:1384357-Amphidinium_carterae.1
MCIRDRPGGWGTTRLVPGTAICFFDFGSWDDIGPMEVRFSFPQGNTACVKRPIFLVKPLTHKALARQSIDKSKYLYWALALDAACDPSWKLQL